MEESLDQEARAELVSQLSATEAEVVVTDVKNQALQVCQPLCCVLIVPNQGKVCIGYCVTSVNGESILTYEYEEAMAKLKDGLASEMAQP